MTGNRTGTRSRALNIAMVVLAAIIVVAGVLFALGVRGVLNTAPDTPYTTSDKVGTVTIERAGVTYALDEGTTLQAGDAVATQAGSSITLAGATGVAARCLHLHYRHGRYADRGFGGLVLPGNCRPRALSCQRSGAAGLDRRCVRAGCADGVHHPLLCAGGNRDRGRWHGGDRRPGRHVCSRCIRPVGAGLVLARAPGYLHVGTRPGSRASGNQPVLYRRPAGAGAAGAHGFCDGRERGGQGHRHIDRGGGCRRASGSADAAGTGASDAAAASAASDSAAGGAAGASGAAAAGGASTMPPPARVP